MRLTAYSNYALRTLQLAALRDPQLTRVDDVVRAHGINRAHITKVVHELGASGFIITMRGRGGGFRLARPAQSISVGAVVRITEGPLTLVECFNPLTNTCPIIEVCILSRKLKEATAAFMAVLDNLTIADISGNREALSTRLLGGLDDGVPAAKQRPEPTLCLTP